MALSAAVNSDRWLQWALQVQPDGWVSIGGGSCIDTAKAANLFSSCPPPAGVDDFMHYVNAPVGV